MNKSLYLRYRHIKERCNNPNNKSYARYGGRGIKMCKEWAENYQAFEEWALANGYREDLAIDRIDNDGDYSPSNCRFVTLKENNQKRRTTRYYTINGVTKNLQQWCDFYGINRGTVNVRLEKGWSIEDALTKPVRKRDKTELIGKRFGRLRVLEYAGDEYIRSNGSMQWICECDCGNKAIISGAKLKNGHTKSCGCLQSEKARERMLNDNPMKHDDQRMRMVLNNPMKRKE